VVDVNDDQRLDHIEQVNKVIDEIGAGSVPQIMVFNKIDISGNIAVMVENHEGETSKIWLSARSGAGIPELKQLIGTYFRPGHQTYRLHLPAEAGKLRARLFEQGAVEDEIVDESGGWI
jgi:GTP-binding protein HflX